MSLKFLRVFGPSTSSRLFSGKIEVSTTGYSYKDGRGKTIAKYGVFWGLKDPKNILQRLPDGSTSISAMYTGILDAVNMAREQETTAPLVIYTDLNNEDFVKELSAHAKRDFYKRDNVTKMKHSEILKEIFTAIQGMDVQIIHRAASGTGKPNYVTEAIIKHIYNPPGSLEDPKEILIKTYCHKEDIGEIEARKLIYEGFCMNEKGQRSPKPSKFPECFVGVRCRSSNKGYIQAGYCSYWPNGEAGSGNVHRFSPFPITAYRATLAAIEEALKEAVENDIRNLIIVTSSAHFIQQWRDVWVHRKEEDRSSKRSRSFYNKIRDLVDKLDNVYFEFKIEHEEQSIYSEIARRCKEGIQYPLLGKDVSEYSLGIQDLTVQEPEEGIPVVRLFKTGSGLTSGVVWENQNEIINRPGIEANLISILEKVDRNEVIIRTDSEKLIKSVEAHLEIWKRNGWRNSLNKKIKREEIWEKIWKLKQTRKIYWQFMDELNEKDIEENRRIPNPMEKDVFVSKNSNE
ncbi:unnamed protein product [Caenorhabditis angaria]|uniref:RNase H type-1 domain-containing protein n=1 Tax=Caenorhabditis angaria TaxID=860376 RepID=A0A9P1IBN4_9PELO|nr:unnamed protein product [Caenorhabditis angaria]